ncbi:hypothetical protein BP5796_07078 [Coleophoma crateriformis]|uniref:Uncharacterized protein n=1 Tax=Coleophoma crateriformis TaxID=565419 RepID=A0A3D8RI52_9HELO|nr:hypothetical protein BP5796_07078 [Coleophoma crateriformis]
MQESNVATAVDRARAADGPPVARESSTASQSATERWSGARTAGDVALLISATELGPAQIRPASPPWAAGPPIFAGLHLHFNSRPVGVPPAFPPYALRHGTAVCWGVGVVHVVALAGSQGSTGTGGG